MDQILWWLTVPFSWSKLQQIGNQDTSRLSLVIITPLVVATAVRLWRQGALGLKAMLGLSAASLFIATFLFVNLG